jgi:DNA polymerase-3 subunit epsilon
VVFNLQLTRPLAVLDLETTGTNPKDDRIVEISILVLNEDGTRRDHKTRRLNPTIPIPKAAQDVHHITDADVKDCPTFKMVARGIADFLAGCDLCGFNLKQFDLRMLIAEFARAEVPFDLEGRAVLDLQEVYHHYEKRGLEQAVQFYLGRPHDNAHSAATDVIATTELIDAMLTRYDKGDNALPRDLDSLSRKFTRPVAVDPDGTLTKREGSILFARTKYRGQSLDEVARRDPDFLNWMLRADFGPDVKKVVRDALDRAKPAAG